MSTPVAIYLSGPITGVANHEEAFSRAEELLVAWGYHPINPCSHQPLAQPCRRGQDTATPATWSEWMRPAIRALTEADGVALLPGWAASRGALWEKRIAENVLALPVLHLSEWEEMGGLLP